MRKKVLSLLLASILTILLIPSGISATESETAETNCYIATTECPQGYIDFAEENVSNFVLSMGESLDYDDIIVGSPFAFADYGADVYYFPVICDDVITYLFRVYPDGDSYSAVISRFLADDIEELSDLTSVQNPMYLNLVNNRIVATIGTEEYVLFEYPDGISDVNQPAVASLIEHEVVDVKETSEIELNLMQTRVFYQYIDLDIIETQSSRDKWCTAYCLSTIIRTQTTFYTTAESCVIIALGSDASTTKAFPWSSIATVSKQYRITPTVLTTTASNSVLMTELNAGNPVIAAMDRGTSQHAIVLRGYSTAGNWSIWNPWFDFYESCSMSGAYVPVGLPSSTNSYYPYAHAYNFEYNS